MLPAMSLGVVPLPLKLPATMQFCNSGGVEIQRPPPKLRELPPVARLPVTVTFVSATAPPQMIRAPPRLPAVLLAKVVFVTLKSGPALCSMPPPLEEAVLLATRQLLMVRVPATCSAPPSEPALLL